MFTYFLCVYSFLLYMLNRSVSTLCNPRLEDFGRSEDSKSGEDRSPGGLLILELDMIDVFFLFVFNAEFTCSSRWQQWDVF